MILFVYAALIGIPVTLACMVLARILTPSDGKAQVISLGFAFLSLTFIAYLMLPGGFTPAKDLSNGILLYLWFAQSFCFCLVSAVSTFFLGESADWIVDRVRGNDAKSLGETFE